MTYALEAIIRSSGDSIKWVRDNLGLFDSFEELDALLDKRRTTKASILCRLRRTGSAVLGSLREGGYYRHEPGYGQAHIVRAALESIAYQVRDAAELMGRESGIPLEEASYGRRRFR